MLVSLFALVLLAGPQEARRQPDFADMDAQATADAAVADATAAAGDAAAAEWARGGSDTAADAAAREPWAGVPIVSPASEGCAALKVLADHLPAFRDEAAADLGEARAFERQLVADAARETAPNVWRERALQLAAFNRQRAEERLNIQRSLDMDQRPAIRALCGD